MGSRMRFLTILAPLPLLACLACGATADSSHQEDAGPGDHPDASLTDTGTLTGTGTIFLEAYGGPSGKVAADVALVERGVGEQATCTSPLDAGAGPCQITSCALGGIGSPAPGYGNFGPISVSVGTTTDSLTYDGFGYGTYYFPSSVTLGTGGTMTFQGGDGASVPKFDVSATIPGLAVITSPLAEADGGAAMIDTSKDLSVTWTPIAIGQINFGFTGGTFTPGGTANTIACTFDGAAGSGVVPQALLSAMKTLSGSSPLAAEVSAELTATTVVGQLTIVTESHQTSTTPIGSFNVTLQ
jgi:hypothetical protein